MASEAEIIKEGGTLKRYFTVTDGTAIAKGSLLVADVNVDRGAKIHTGGPDDVPVGFATHEKEADDGATTMSVQRTGVVQAIAGNTIDQGNLVVPGATVNRVEAVTGGTFSLVTLACIIGSALDDAAAGGECNIAVRL